MATFLVSRGVPYSDVRDMGGSQIISLSRSLDKAKWKDRITEARLAQISAQGSGKDLTKALRPIERELENGERDNLSEIQRLVEDLGTKR